MRRSGNPELAEQWCKRIHDWRQSGKTVLEWCKEQQIKEHQFWYWRKRLADDSRISTKRGQFVELTDNASSRKGLCIQTRELTIRLEPDFDETTLLRCLRVLRRASC